MWWDMRRRIACAYGLSGSISTRCGCRSGVELLLPRQAFARSDRVIRSNFCRPVFFACKLPKNATDAPTNRMIEGGELDTAVKLAKLWRESQFPASDRRRGRADPQKLSTNCRRRI